MNTAAAFPRPRPAPILTPTLPIPNPVPPFEKGGLGGISAVPAEAKP